MDIGNRLKECDLGITEYISKYPGFSAIIKERYSDFHVNEIDLDGQIAKLTHQNIPSDSDDNVNIEDLRTMISSAIWDQLQVLKDNPSSTIQIDVTNIDKTERRNIHTIAQNLANVISQTTIEDDKKFIMIIPKNIKTGKFLKHYKNLFISNLYTF